MDKLMLVLHLFLSVALFPYPVCADNRREDLIQDSVRRLLGVRSDRTEGAAPLPPRYVMDLYEKYRSGRTPMQGNTVRSILPMRDTIGDADVLIFNLTGISSSEQILQSKLYLLKRRKPKPGRKREGSSHFRINMGSLPHMTSHRHLEVSLTRHKSEWHSYDITESVVHCRQHSRNSDSLLAMTLEVKRAKGSYRLSPFRRLLKHDSQPFVLIFSEDSNNQSRSLPKGSPGSGFQGLLTAKAESLLSEEQQESSEELRERSKRSIYQPVFVDSNSSQIPLRSDLGRARSLAYSGIFQDLEHLKAKVMNATSHLERQRLFSDIVNKPSLETLRNRPRRNDRFPASLGEKSRSLKKVIEIAHVINAISYFKRHRLLGGVFNESSLETLRAFHSSWNHPRRNDSVAFSNSLGEYNRSPGRTLTSAQKGSFEKVLVKSLERRLGTDDDHQDAPTRLKRSVSGASSKEMDSDSVANTFQTVSERYKSRLNKTVRASAARRNRNRGSRKLKKKKRRRNHKLPFWWTRHDDRLHSQDYGKLCQRRSLVVDFVKLGWGDWVISPKSFNAHYCSGGCSFPLIKNASPSNHAAIQSLVYAIGLSPNVPTPCCVPSLSSPLTLLYFDEHGNLVLKNYPNMIVDKCACR